MRILIVDDERSARQMLSDILCKLDDCEIEEASSLEEARSKLSENTIDVALIDIRLGHEATNRDGMTLIEEVSATTKAIPIVVTAFSEKAEIRRAMRSGARDYILKDDLSDEMVLPAINELRGRLSLEREVRTLRARAATEPPATGLVGASPAMETLRHAVQRVAMLARTVLVLGPTGSGKELVVQAIHKLGPHPDELLLEVNCAAIPETLMEGTLFGHEKGSFTGATHDQKGYLAAVGDGTLFLDEIAELSLPLQAKLLRVLETKTFRPVGAIKEKRFTGSVVAATHADLDQRVKDGQFRKDLFFRLNAIPVRVPSLQERREDIPALVAHFAAGQPRPLKFSEDALAALSRRPWTGNVRELRNAVEWLNVFCQDDPITSHSLDALPIWGADAEVDDSTKLSTIARTVLSLSIEDKMARIEDALKAEALKSAKGNKSHAARLLGIHRKSVQRGGNPNDTDDGDPSEE